MKVSPYLIFNGNCVEAIALYEKAFNTKASYCQYKDTPPSEEYPVRPGTEELVMHGTLPVGTGTIYLADTTPDQPVTFSHCVVICVELDTAEDVRAAFDVLKEGGKVLCAVQETFWSKCYAELEDRFGLKWGIMVEE